MTLSPWRLQVLLPIMGLVLGVLVVLSLGAGSVAIPPGRVLAVLTGNE
ncbi:MAG: hypothetical protein IT369_20195, partial [Candidatus Latescibacteria bacterium]|nr:hypothetical protein [Candidatus Latescibacterota bacterium]